MRIVAVIQARLGSTRLPGKILLPLGGKSMLQNVVERVQRANLHDVWCTIPGDWGAPMLLPTLDRCDVLVNWSLEASTNDLIYRLLDTARTAKADAIIRVCADNPCVEPEEIDRLVLIQKATADFYKRILLVNSEHFDQNFDGFGGEFYTLETLEWMDKVIKDPLYREHPHKIWHYLGLYNYVGEYYPPGFRLDVNTPAEYEKLKDIYDHFEHNRFTVKEVMEYLGTKNLEERPVLT